MKTKCDRCEREPFSDESLYERTPLPKCECGGMLRVNVVWFGEMLNDVSPVFEQLARCTAFIAIGTSGVVEPVASFVRSVSHRNTLYIGPEKPANAEAFAHFMIGPATEMVPRLQAALQ